MSSATMIRGISEVQWLLPVQILLPMIPGNTLVTSQPLSTWLILPSDHWCWSLTGLDQQSAWALRVPAVSSSFPVHQSSLPLAQGWAQG